MESVWTSFGFRALWTPELLVGIVILAILYGWLIHIEKKRVAVDKHTKLRHKLYFGLGLLALYGGWGSPFYLTGHMIMSIHMLQMVLAYFVAVPLLLLGIPTWLLEQMSAYLKKKGLQPVIRLIGNPILALFLFNGLFSFYHVPFMFDSLMQSPVLHSFYQYALLFAAVLMWWHMLAPLPSAYRLSDLRRIGYIFANGILITPACALIIFAPETMYATYTDPLVWANVMSYCLPAGSEIPMGLFNGPATFNLLDARMDQQLAGVLMKIMQEIVYGITIGYVFKQWLRKEKQQEGAVTISDVPTTH
ncbi:cytochrome c oxidase assembly factor CtaG [Alkalicoccobacillus porphyridii]|uniref:Cytochrome c oxidase assembly factor CtaG n=1 Tax=Alkalicoccobacillus porphyridii TaxID=2597270 RepID=A0A553ZXG7_9BACI|nr:cytochrome c oxidase assembly factor CtaG [Alkalicoccobacillus porphyridii]TSB46151.1 cytochrome c oxidase assembly factor CtaG [Alkalicoccobacillus porphyridii]